MNHSKVHFSWENEPGVSKTPNQGSPNEGGYPLKLLPPPPCVKSENARVSVHDKKIPLPPSRSFSRKSFSRKEQLEDPFMVALKECTKSNTEKKGDKSYENKGHVVSAGLKKKQKGFFNFSCKQSCGVVDYKFLIKNSVLPQKKNEED
ncbi:hypothetical protein LWI28_016331 [Acer negundo]|uniref:Uncharacterized protein n=1 Tax=Acer negundo TaxID=4023 RepID=A0AAD5P5G5_ACENE|nr:hypothetical protein LWI28_016331 [Acer negundo]KAK4860627.1 hypothetical protein QYF36_027480 [Acer negundo]